MMKTPLPLRTRRLVLRPFLLTDAAALHHLAGDRAIADTMITVPHPLARETVERWIVAFQGQFEQGAAVHYAIMDAGEEDLLGTAALLDIDTEHQQAEMSFWIGVPYWGRGYASEAARRLVQYAFDELDLNRLYAHHMVRNPASGRVLANAGMRQEGVLRQRVRKWGVFEDVVLCAILREDYDSL